MRAAVEAWVCVCVCVEGGVGCVCVCMFMYVCAYVCIGERGVDAR